MLIDTRVFRWIRNTLLVAALLASPVAVAAIASYDLAGVVRSAPSAIGAMESVSNVGSTPPGAIPAPTGLAVQRI